MFITFFTAAFLKEHSLEIAKMPINRGLIKINNTSTRQ